MDWKNSKLHRESLSLNKNSNYVEVNAYKNSNSKSFRNDPKKYLKLKIMSND